MPRFLFCMAALVVPAAAQDAPAPIKFGDVIVTGSLRSRAYFWNWFEPAAGDNTYQYSASLLRVSVSQNRGSWDWNAEFAAPLLFGLPSRATGTGPQQGALGLGANDFAANSGHNNAAMIFLKQGYVRFDGLGGDKRQTLKLGRFEFMDGSELAPKNSTLATLKRDRVAQRLIGNFGFSDVGRSFDGVHYAFATAKDNVTFVGAMATRGVFQTDGWGWNRVGFGYTSYTRQSGAGRHSADTR